jgi:hypothetical protein
VEEIIEEGIEWETFRAELDPRFARLFILSVVNWLYQWYRPEGPLPPDAVAARMSDLILNGIARETV